VVGKRGFFAVGIRSVVLQACLPVITALIITSANAMIRVARGATAAPSASAPGPSKSCTSGLTIFAVKVVLTTSLWRPAP